MNKFYRRFICLIIFVIGISGTVIYTTVDINTLTNLHQFKPWSLVLAVLAVSLGMYFDGTRLMHLVHISNEKITFYQAVQVVFGNYFLALLTPGNAGGAVAQIMFLRHAGVPTGKAAVMAVVRTVLSILFLAVCMPFIFLHDEVIVPGVSNDVLMLITLAAFAMFMLIVFAARRGYLDYLIFRIARKLSPARRDKIFAIYKDTRDGMILLAKSPRKMIRVFIESGLNLLCIYAVVPCLLLGLGVTDADWYTVMGRMIFLNMLIYFSPTPGGSGFAEGGFVLLFADSTPAGTVGIIAVFWRLVAEYLPFLIGGYYTLTVFGRDFLKKSEEAEIGAAKKLYRK